MNALTAMSWAEPGSAGAVKAVSVISTGTVRIRPEHPYGSRKPLYWWLLTSRRWTPPRPINVYVIEHARGLILFDTGQDRASVTDVAYFPGGVAGLIYNRLARFDIGEDDTLTAQLATTDLVRTMPRLDVPLVMAQGRLDQVAPGEAAQRFHDSLTAPSKQLVWFESSAHTPHLEEPAKFRDLLMNVRASQLTST